MTDTAAEARARTAEAENGRLREALSSLKRHCHKHHQGDDSCNCDEIDAALAASAPETKPGERESVAEALLQWAAEGYLDSDSICPLCDKSLVDGFHAPDCLHLRAGRGK